MISPAHGQQCRQNPTNPAGQCWSCQSVMNSIFRLPCLRFKISDSILFRTGFPFLAFYKMHPMVGKTYGDFHNTKEWTSGGTKLLEITQGRGSVCRFEVREFQTPDEGALVDSKERAIYAIPWAIVDADAATNTLNSYLDESMASYLDSILGGPDHLVRDVFQSALRLSMHPEPVSVQSFLF